MERHFYRCGDCTNVFAINGPQVEPQCDCGSSARHMGRVAADRLERDEVHCACDSRCTSATGPKCNCQCRGENHGTGRVVAIVVDAGGIPVASPTGNLPARLEIKREYFAARQSASDRIKAAHGDAITSINAGLWVADRAKWDAARAARMTYLKASRTASHKSRIAALAKICA